MARTTLTAGELLDLLDRAYSVIEESVDFDEHLELTNELEEVRTLLREQIDGSHMGTGADVVIIGEEEQAPASPAPTLNEAAPGPGYGKCGECLMNAVEVVQIGQDGKCPRCGANYGPEVGDGR